MLGFADGQVRVARVGPEALVPGVEVGDTVKLHFLVGVVTAVHRPGLFLSADLEAASSDNERNSIMIRTPEGAEVVAVQIAGLIARRIACYVKAGDKVAIGDTYGLIRYGSRLDTYLPAGSNVLVTTGQRSLAGETVLAELL